MSIQFETTPPPVTVRDEPRPRISSQLHVHQTNNPLKDGFYLGLGFWGAASLCMVGMFILFRVYLSL